MADEAKQLLREIRDIAAKCEARDTEWIAEMRKASNEGVQRWNESDARGRRFGHYSSDTAPVRRLIQTEPSPRDRLLLPRDASSRLLYGIGDNASASLG
jgi:hypothetical protein